MGELDIRLLREDSEPDPRPEPLLEMYRRRVPAMLCPWDAGGTLRTEKGQVSPAWAVACRLGKRGLSP